MDIVLTAVSKRYRRGALALHGLDLTVPGGMYGLLGANGAGKTTLMRLLAGLLRPTEGTVTVGGHDLATRSGRQAVRRMLGYLPQEAGVYPDLTAREFLDYIALLKGIDRAADRRRQVGAMLEVVGLAGHAGEKLRTFSGGMRRRVGIAQALVADPRLLIVDEPTAGLDPQERVRFRTLLAQLAGDRTVLLSTHIVEDVAQTARRVGVLGAGRLLFTGTVEELTRRAHGRVWTVTTGTPPPPDATVVSALPGETGVRYRLVSARAPGGDAVPVDSPTLEDGYLALTLRAG
jgi:ABC-2 type transport system ATP-binding protein